MRPGIVSRARFAIPLALCLVLAGRLAAQQTAAVARIVPEGNLPLDGVITVIFDAPVLRALDPRGSGAEQYLSIEPAIRGVTEWRDPVTLRFRPAEAFTPGRRYTIRVRDGAPSDTGRARVAAFSTELVAEPPRIQAIEIPDRSHLPRDPRVLVLYNAPPTGGDVERTLRIEFDDRCRGPRHHGLRVLRMREVRDDDPYLIRYGAYGSELTRSSRRVVEAAPESLLPAPCTGVLVQRHTRRDRPDSAMHHIATRDSLRLVGVACVRWRASCPQGGLHITFTTPVMREEVERHLRIVPAPAGPVVVKRVYDHGEQPAAEWWIDTQLLPRTTYGVSIATGMTDVFGQSIVPRDAWMVGTTDLPRALLVPGSDIYYALGSDPVVRTRAGSDSSIRVALRHLSGDALLPWLVDRMRPPLREPPDATFSVPVLPPGPRDSAAVTDIRLPVPDRRAAGLTFASIGSETVRVHRTGLAVHAHVGSHGGAVLVLGMTDLRPRAGATVTIIDSLGSVLARAQTGRDGVARLSIDAATIDTTVMLRHVAGFRGRVHVEHGGDRTYIVLPDATPLGNVTVPYGQDHIYHYPGEPGSQLRDAHTLLAGTVLTDRGIYRPGEMLYVHGIVRAGVLGALTVPQATDSIRWSIHRRWHPADAITRPAVLSELGTAADSFRLGTSLPLGDYTVALERRILGQWVAFGATSMRIAEYRAPSFLVTLRTPARVEAGLDSLHGAVSARYLFDAPLARARVTWGARVGAIHGSMLQIPGHEQYRFGHWGFRPMPGHWTASLDSARLDADGAYRIAVPLDSLRVTTLARMWLTASVTDADRQVIAAESETTIHPVAHYVGARTKTWIVGRRSVVEVVAAAPDGQRMTDVPVEVLVRRPRDQDWSRMWADSTPLDTVGGCSLRTGRAPVPCALVPSHAGIHEVILTSTDSRGRASTTTIVAWAIGPSPWRKENPYALEVTAARDEYVPSDTLEVTFTSPFPRAQAWITVDRETVLASEVREVGAGLITHRMVIPPRWAPNVFISVMLVAPVPSGPIAVHPRPLVVSGRTEVRIKPLGRSLTVAVEPRSKRADAGDTVRVDVRVTDADGRGIRSDVAVWAVDEGILSLTGFETPDPIAGLYRRRDRMMRDASTLTSLARETPVLQFVGNPYWMALDRMALGAAASGSSAVRLEALELRQEAQPGSLRRDFRSTAFFIGLARTDARGHVTVAAKLPDNLTTFRVMAVATSAGDTYGSGSSSLTVTRPLIARPALPRFARPGDAFIAGAVVHRENHAPATARLEVEASGIHLTGLHQRDLVVRDGIGSEGRFGFRVPGRDSVSLDAARSDTVTVRLSASDGRSADAVETTFAIRPDFQPRWHTITGIVRDTATVELALPPGTDPIRSRLVIAAASSPTALIRRANAWFDVYPYACTEQLVSAGFAMTSLARAERASGETMTLDTAKLQRIVDRVLARQGDDGSFGYWDRNGWTSYWLSAYAGLFLLDAREMGASVRGDALTIAGHFLDGQFHAGVEHTNHGDWWNIDPRARMSDRVAALDFFQRHTGLDTLDYLDRTRRGRVAEVVALAPRMAWEDRVRLAEVLWRANGDGDRATASGLLRDAWTVARVLGNRLSMPDTLGRGTLFFSRTRPAARLLTATLAIRPDDPRLGPLAELLIVHGRADERWVWSTQDWGPAVVALAGLATAQRDARITPVRVLAGSTELARLEHGSDSVATSLVPVVVRGSAGDSVRVRFQVRGGGAPVFFHASVEEIPRERPLEPDQSGMIVSRWYERATDGAPITEITEGELVRVRLRVTVPSDRFFVVVDDALPAGLEVVDLGLRTAGGIGTLDVMQRAPAGPAVPDSDPESPWGQAWLYGDWWSPWDHREYRDDRVILSARMLWRGTYSATYLARATTVGTFVRPPAHAEEMYNRGVNGRSDGGTFTVREARR